MGALPRCTPVYVGIISKTFDAVRGCKSATISDRTGVQIITCLAIILMATWIENFRKHGTTPIENCNPFDNSIAVFGAPKIYVYAINFSLV